eukprot:6210990-Pleurochrysis_carterae.AAC.1
MAIASVAIAQKFVTRNSNALYSLIDSLFPCPLPPTSSHLARVASFIIAMILPVASLFKHAGPPDLLLRHVRSRVRFGLPRAQHQPRLHLLPRLGTYLAAAPHIAIC